MKYLNKIKLYLVSMTLQDNLKTFKGYINYKAILISLIAYIISFFIFNSFIKEIVISALISGFLIGVMLEYITQNSKEDRITFLIIIIILVIGSYALSYPW